MKRLLIHIVALLFVLQLPAQILAPMGEGLPAAPDKIAKHGNGVVVAYDNRDNVIEVKMWNGDFWNSTGPINIPPTTEKFKIADLYSFNSSIYLASSYETRPADKSNFISKWDGNSWVDISTDIISNSIAIDKLFEENGVLKCVGKFKNQNENYNIVKYTNGLWIPEGNVITSNFDNDKFASITQSGSKLIATGVFTNPVANRISLAEWNGHQWQATAHPPFLGENIALGKFQDNLVVYGKSEFNTESVQISISGNWRGMSKGLENYDVNSIHQFAEINNSLFAVGEFVNKTNNASSNLMMFDGDKWAPTNLNVISIDQVYSDDKNILMSGDFSDNSRLNGIGVVYSDRAQIAAKVYEDKNSNCIKDGNEDWLANYPITLSGTSTSFYSDQKGQLYLPVFKDNHAINAKEDNYYAPTCPDFVVDVNEYKTYYGAVLGVKQQSDIFDVTVNITDNNSFNSTVNERKTAYVCVDNIGSKFLSNALLKLELASGIDNLQSELPFDTYSGKEATWIINLDANKNQCFTVSYTVLDQENSTIKASILPATGIRDNDESNNESTIKYKTGDSPDNYKHCANGAFIAPSTDNMSYKIGFKNTTGNTALGLKVVDILDADIAMRKLVYSTSHHPNAKTLVELHLAPDGTWRHKIITSIDNVRIPSTSEDEQSKGFVDYNITLKPLEKGSEICNTAKIYFSYSKNANGEATYYNEPIVTNEVCSVVGEVLAVEKNETNGIVVSSFQKNLFIGPNPVTNFLHFDNKGHESFKIEIVNTLGQTVNTVDIKSFKSLDLDLTSFDSGIYFIYTNGVFAKKFMLR